MTGRTVQRSSQVRPLDAETLWRCAGKNESPALFRGSALTDTIVLQGSHSRCLGRPSLVRQNADILLMFCGQLD
jgi:hypothetical protein